MVVFLKQALFTDFTDGHMEPILNVRGKKYGGKSMKGLKT